MPSSKADIIAQLQKEILGLQGLRSATVKHEREIDLDIINNAFPEQRFPTGAIHEFISAGVESFAASNGFVSGILGQLMQSGGAAIWVSTSRTIFPPALKFFGIEPDRIIFIDLKKEKDVLWAMEEALKCPAIVAVIGEIKDLSFTNSRRLQLAVEQSRVTGFVLRQFPKNLNANACVSRWQINSMISDAVDGLPGIGFPKWRVDLLKIRNGKPGSWQISFERGRFIHIDTAVAIPELQRKIS